MRMTYCIKFSKQINKPEPSFSIVRRVFLWPQFLFYFVLLQLWRVLFEFINTLPKSVEIQVDTRIERGNFEHYKNHPGKNVFRALRIPEYLEETITDVLGNKEIPSLKVQAEKLYTYLHDRRVQLEKNEVNSLREKIKDELLPKFSESEKLEMEAERILGSKIHHSIKLKYNTKESLLYLASRFVPDYAALVQIFREIKKKDVNFQPKYLFDFASGTGTVMWAARDVWQETIEEFFNHDISPEINQISDLITKNNSLSNPSKIKGAVYKRNNPKSQEEFDIVTCAFSLFEFENRLERFKVIESLWRKVKTNGYLVLTEIGTKHGFRLINEAREFALTKLLDSEETHLNGHIFSPCPHHQQCPMLKQSSVCRFFVSYYPLRIINKSDAAREFPYSYLVFKKSSKQNAMSKWPRFVYRNPFIVNGDYKSWICSPNGSIEHLISTRKKDKITRSLVKYSKLGDELPGELQFNEETKKN